MFYRYKFSSIKLFDLHKFVLIYQWRIVAPLCAILGFKVYLYLGLDQWLLYPLSHLPKN